MKRFSVILFALAVVLYAMADVYSDMLNAGIKAYNSGNYQKAMTFFNTANEQAPKGRAASWINKCKKAIDDKKKQERMQKYNKARDAGISEFNKEHYQDALDHFVVARNYAASDKEINEWIKKCDDIIRAEQEKLDKGVGLYRQWLTTGDTLTRKEAIAALSDVKPTSEIKKMLKHLRSYHENNTWFTK